MKQHEKLNYVEFPARDLDATRKFFSEVFAWDFEDFGPDYCAFAEQGLDGGFYRSELYSTTLNGAALLVFYSENLEATQSRIEQAGGRIEKPIFSFPGGKGQNLRYLVVYCSPDDVLRSMNVGLDALHGVVLGCRNLLQRGGMDDVIYAAHGLGHPFIIAHVADEVTHHTPMKIM